MVVRSRLNLALAAAGMVTIIAAAATVALLHVVPPSAYVNPVRRTISEYALLDNGWVFDLAVLTLAAGSIAVLVALVGARLVPATSVGAAALLLYGVSMAGVVAFPKHNWAVGPGVNGDIHRVAGLVGFVSLPVAALLVGRLWRRDARWRAYAYTAAALGTLSLLCFSPIVIAILTEPWTGVRWWRAVPLGAVERALALSEVATVLALAWWAVRASGEATPTVPPPAEARPAPAGFG
jgi:hypothetical protein